MQGYILHTQRVRDEDLIVYILSKNKLLKAYRFYGLRHSSILSGYKIDFALEEHMSFLPRLKDTMHLGFEWILNREKMLIWQEFIRLFYRHLKDIEECDSFYFELLNESAKRFARQNSKRVILDAYLELLSFEGRLHTKFRCFVCDELIDNENIGLVRAFLPAHKDCAFVYEVAQDKLKHFYKNKNSSIFDDNEVSDMYKIIKEGF